MQTDMLQTREHGVKGLRAPAPVALRARYASLRDKRVFITGGGDSLFVILYMLPIVAASTVQFRRGGLQLAVLNSILFVGVVVAQLGTVVLAAGEAYTLQFEGTGLLSNVIVTPATMKALVDNGNAVQAPGGMILLSAQAASRLQAGVVLNTGTLQASGLIKDGGRIMLRASDRIQLGGEVLAVDRHGFLGEQVHRDGVAAERVERQHIEAL